jgi:phosphoribosylformylglycinamidine synthase
MDLKEPGNLLYLLGETYPELGGSEYYRLKGFLGSSVPKLHATKARRTYYNLTKAMGEGIIRSCHDLSEGGLAVAAAEMAFAGGYGLELDLRSVPNKSVSRNDFLLFSESNSRFLLEVAEQDRSEFEELIRNKACAPIGKVTKAEKLLIRGLDGKVVVDVGLAELRRSWKKTLSMEAQNE